MAIDKTTMATELHTGNIINITLTASGGFSGAVAVAPTMVDDAGAPLTAWTVAVDLPSVTLPLNGTANVKATVMIPSDTTVLSGKLNVGVTGAPAALSGSTTFSVTPVVTQLIKNDGAGNCVYPADALTTANAIKIHVGTKVHFLNNFGAAIIIHSNGVAEGIDHEGQGNAANIVNTADNDFYERTASAAGANPFSWYCHNNNDDGVNDPFLMVIP